MSHLQSILSPVLNGTETSNQILDKTDKVQSKLLNDILDSYVSILHDIIKNHPNRVPMTLSKTTKNRMSIKSSRSSSIKPSSSSQINLWHPPILDKSSNPLTLSPKIQNVLAMIYIFDSWLKLSIISRDLGLSNVKRIKPTSNAFNLLLKTLSRFLMNLNPNSSQLLNEENESNSVMGGENLETLRLIAERIYWELQTEAELSEKKLTLEYQEGAVKSDESRSAHQDQDPEQSVKPVKRNFPAIRENMFSKSNLDSLLIAFGTAGVPERGVEILKDWSDYHSYAQKSKEIDHDDLNREIDGIPLEGWSNDVTVWSSLIQSHVLAKDLKGASVWLERYRSLSKSSSTSSTSTFDPSPESDASALELETTSIRTSNPPIKSSKPYLVFLSGCVRLLSKKRSLQAIKEGKEAMRKDGIEFGAEVLSFLERVEWQLGRGWKVDGREGAKEVKVLDDGARNDSESKEEVGEDQDQLRALVSRHLGVDFFSRTFLRQLNKAESRMQLNSKSSSSSNLNNGSSREDSGPNPISSLSLLSSPDQLGSSISNVKLSKMLTSFTKSPRSTLKLLLYFHYVVSEDRKTKESKQTRNGKKQSVSTHLLNLGLESLTYGNLRAFNQYRDRSSGSSERFVREMDLPAILILLQSFKSLGLEPNERTHRLALACCLKIQRSRMGMRPWSKKKGMDEVDEKDNLSQMESQEQAVGQTNFQVLKNRSDPNFGDKLEEIISTEGSDASSGRTKHPDVLHFSSKPPARGVRDLNYHLETIEKGIELELRAAYSLKQFTTLESRDLNKDVLNDFNHSSSKVDDWALRLVGWGGEAQELGQNQLVEELEKVFEKKDGNALLRLVMSHAKDAILPRKDQLRKGGKGRVRMSKR